LQIEVAAQYTMDLLEVNASVGRVQAMEEHALLDWREAENIFYVCVTHFLKHPEVELME
jgi:hypothetical protein